MSPHTIFIISPFYSVEQGWANNLGHFERPRLAGCRNSLWRFALNRPCPVRKRLNWTHALCGIWHPGGELVKLHRYGCKESGTGVGE